MHGHHEKASTQFLLYPYKLLGYLEIYFVVLQPISSCLIMNTSPKQIETACTRVPGMQGALSLQNLSHEVYRFFSLILGRSTMGTMANIPATVTDCSVLLSGVRDCSIYVHDTDICQTSFSLRERVQSISLTVQFKTPWSCHGGYPFIHIPWSTW